MTICRKSSGIGSRGPPRANCGSVLAAVDRELERDLERQPARHPTAARLRWDRVLAGAIAASLLLGVGLNVWQRRAEEAWQARVFGPRPISRELSDVVQAVASVTDAQTGQWLQQRLSQSRPGPSLAHSHPIDQRQAQDF